MRPNVEIMVAADNFEDLLFYNLCSNSCESLCATEYMYIEYHKQERSSG